MEIPIPKVQLYSELEKQKPSLSESEILIEEFLALKNLARNSKRSYQFQITRFFRWSLKDWEEITVSDIRRYKSFLEDAKNLQPNSVSQALNTLKSFFAWLQQREKIKNNPLKAVEVPLVPSPVGRMLEPSILEKLLASAAQKHPRDEAIIYLLFHCGLRASEISQLNCGDYNGQEIIIRQAKSNSVGMVPVDDPTHLSLSRYLQHRARKKELLDPDPMFVSFGNKNRGQRLGYQGIYYMVKSAAARAGLSNIHPHLGRHTFASNLLKDGMDAYLAMRLTRHKSIKTFQAYSKTVEYEIAKSTFFRQQEVKLEKRQNQYWMSLRTMHQQEN